MQYANKLMLLILDGTGVADDNRGNAVSLSKPSNLIRLWDANPHTYLHASGEHVGLPKGVYGNSEVGHMNIGGGRVILQNLPRINKAIASGSYKNNQTLAEMMRYCIEHNSAMHIMGLLSDGAVHSHIDHFIATLEVLRAHNFKQPVYIHAFTDGRDTHPQSAYIYLDKLQKAINSLQIGEIASIVGRSLAMDRNSTWPRTEKAYKLLRMGEGTRDNDWNHAIQAEYSAGRSDEYIEPIILATDPAGSRIKDGDAVLHMNYRADRAIQLSNALTQPGFNHFPVTPLQNIYFAGMVEYMKDLPKHVLFPKNTIHLSLGKLLSDAGYKQLRIAESEKFPHVTYFFNGGMPVQYMDEYRIEVPSPNVVTYDLKPEMSAPEMTDIILERITMQMYDIYIVNFAPPDMVGHTGNLEAGVKAMQATDHNVGKLVERFTAAGGTVIITADHGNIEEMIKINTGEVDTEHSNAPVPFIVIDPQNRVKTLRTGALKDIAPTILKLLELNIPEEMNGAPLY